MTSAPVRAPTMAETCTPRARSSRASGKTAPVPNPPPISTAWPVVGSGTAAPSGPAKSRNTSPTCSAATSALVRPTSLDDDRDRACGAVEVGDADRDPLAGLADPHDHEVAGGGVAGHERSVHDEQLGDVRQVALLDDPCSGIHDHSQEGILVFGLEPLPAPLAPRPRSPPAVASLPGWHRCLVLPISPSQAPTGTAPPDRLGVVGDVGDAALDLVQREEAGVDRGLDESRRRRGPRSSSSAGRR